MQRRRANKGWENAPAKPWELMFDREFAEERKRQGQPGEDDGQLPKELPISGRQSKGRAHEGE